MFDPDKYIVTKKDGTPLEPGTFFVIRDTDLLGVLTLRTYQGSIGLAIDMNALGGLSLTPEQVDYLASLSAGVDGMARDWESKNGSRRLPD